MSTQSISQIASVVNDITIDLNLAWDLVEVEEACEEAYDNLGYPQLDASTRRYDEVAYSMSTDSYLMASFFPRMNDWKILVSFCEALIATTEGL